MPEVTIYHNPRCSKSRQTLKLLRQHDVVPNVIEYLKEPPDEATLRSLLKKLGIGPRDLIRSREYRALDLPETDDDDERIRRMAAHPEILERPIVVAGGQAVLGRPPENVLKII